jgi:hypothetical protein
VILAAAILAVAGACGHPSPVATLQFQALPFKPAADGQWQAPLDQWTVTLLNADKADVPTAWEGPLRIRSQSGECQADLSLVTRVYGAGAVDYLVALTYSGSQKYVHFVELKSCREKWPAWKAFSDKIELAGDSLSIDPSCECPGGLAPCVCSAAQVYRLSADRLPQPLPAAARALTGKVLGVEFEGERKVLRPRTAGAELLKDGLQKE